MIISIKNQNSDVYGECFSITNDGLKYKGYFGFSADNFDEEHVNDIDLYSLKVYNTDGNTDFNKSLRGDKEIDPSILTSKDLFHRYRTKLGGINSKRVNLNDNIEDSKVSTVTVEVNDSNVDLMVKFRELEKVYRDHVDGFEENIASLDANTAQIIEFNKQKVYNMSLTFQNIDKKTQNLYSDRMVSKEVAPPKDARVDALKDAISSLDQKIGLRFLLIYS